MWPQQPVPLKGMCTRATQALAPCCQDDLVLPVLGIGRSTEPPPEITKMVMSFSVASSACAPQPPCQPYARIGAREHTGCALPCLGACTHCIGAREHTGCALPCLGACTHCIGAREHTGCALPCLGTCTHCIGAGTPHCASQGARTHCTGAGHAI